MIKVLIAYNMKILRECLKMVIDQDDELEVVGETGNGRKAVEMSRIYHPDVILMDLNMQVYSGYDAIVDIKEYDSKIKILILTTETDEGDITSAFINGADGYIPMDIDINGLLIIIKKVFNVEKYAYEYGFSTGQKIAKNSHNNMANARYMRINFTEREKEVLELVTEGLTNVEIAEKLGMSTGRARNIVAELISKCMVKNRTQLAVTMAKVKMIIEQNK
jgi:DNA-binding NarL/FixJ family response regulator